MFISIGQTVATDNKWTQIRSSYLAAEHGKQPRISVAWGWGDSILLDITEAKQLALELEQALRDAWSDDAEGIA